MAHYKNPDYEAVGTEITVKSPLFMSSISDALATFVEAEASYANKIKNIKPRTVCQAGSKSWVYIINGDLQPPLSE